LIAIGTAVLLALLTNWLRIFLLVVIGYQTEMKSSLMEDHEFFGWVLFALVMLPAIYYAPVLPPKAASHTESPFRVKPLLPFLALVRGPPLTLLARTAVDAAPQFSLRSSEGIAAVAPGPVMPVSYPARPLTSPQHVMLQDVAIRGERAQYVKVDGEEK